jgi:hypothetical protein
MATPTLQYLEGLEHMQLSETSALLPANLLVPSITLKKQNGDTHHPLEEHVSRRPGKPNLHTYTIPYIDCDIHTFIKNLGTTAVSLLQTCVPTHGECLPVVVALSPPNGEIELPLTRAVPGDKCAGFDILDPQTKQVLLELRFLYAPMPAIKDTDAIHGVYDHSPHEEPKGMQWWRFWRTRANADTSITSTPCDVIAENALDDTQHTAVLAQMRAMLLA